MALFISLRQDARERLAVLARSAYATIPAPWERHLPPIMAICSGKPLSAVIDFRSETVRREKHLRRFPAIFGDHRAEDRADISRIVFGFYGDEEYLIYLADVTGNGEKAAEEEIKEQFLLECAIALLRNASFWNDVPPSLIDGQERLTRLCDSILHFFSRFCLGSNMSDQAEFGSLSLLTELDNVLRANHPCLQ